MELSKKAEYMREYNQREGVKEKAYERSRIAYANLTEEQKQAHKDKCKQYHYNNLDRAKQYRQNNKESINEYMKEYRKTHACKKSSRITNWKKSGVKCDDFNSLYDKYINCKNCEECNVELQEGNAKKNKKCLDHDHKTGLFRNIICNRCNTIRGIKDRKIN
jgi:hypothetical protein